VQCLQSRTNPAHNPVRTFKTSQPSVWRNACGNRQDARTFPLATAVDAPGWSAVSGREGTNCVHLAASASAHVLCNEKDQLAGVIVSQNNTVILVLFR